MSISRTIFFSEHPVDITCDACLEKDCILDNGRDGVDAKANNNAETKEQRNMLDNERFENQLRLIRNRIWYRASLTPGFRYLNMYFFCAICILIIAYMQIWYFKFWAQFSCLARLTVSRRILYRPRLTCTGCSGKIAFFQNSLQHLPHLHRCNRPSTLSTQCECTVTPIGW